LESFKLDGVAYDHSQHGLLPEAVNPKPKYPLPTTSPLTYSSTMFVIVALSSRLISSITTYTMSTSSLIVSEIMFIALL